MATYDEIPRFCRDCGHNVLARRRGTSHVLHLILTLVTGGLWLLIWIPQSIKFGGWRCPQCGSGHVSGAR